jgi:hypothetical protein
LALTDSSIAQVSLGYYEKEVDAARAYDAESLRLRGPNGHINLPESRTLAEARSPEMVISQANSTGWHFFCHVLWHVPSLPA